MQNHTVVQQLQGKLILVTGATGTLGSEVCKLLKQSGARLLVTGRNKDKLEALRTSLELEEQNCLAADLTKKEDINALGNHLAQHNLQPDVLLMLHGIGILKPFVQLTDDDFEQTIQTNLVAPFKLVKLVLPSMLEKGKGLIVNIPGVLGKAPMAGASAYAASKYALTGMMQSLREEIKRTEIRITNLYMGGADTAFWDTIDMKVQRNKMIASREAARAIWFLLQQPDSGVVSEMVLQPFNHQVL